MTLPTQPELDRLKQEFVDHVKCGRVNEAARTLAERDELLLTELVSGSELASLFGVKQSAVSNWIQRHDNFPAPRTGRDRTARYSRSEVVEWWAGRHPKLVAALMHVTRQGGAQ